MSWPSEQRPVTAQSAVRTARRLHPPRAGQRVNRTLYLIAYDIACNQRRAQVHRLLTGYKVAGQRSAFECWLTKADLYHLLADLAQQIEPDQDRIHLFQLDPRMPVQCAGRADTFQHPWFMVV